MKRLEEITWEELEPEVRRLAAENPDYRYPMMRGNDGPACFYTLLPSGNTGQAVCIFGRALMNLGVPQDELFPYEGAPVHSLLCHSSFDLEDRSSWIQLVQDQQDTRFTWSDAVADADTNYPLEDSDVH